MGKNLVCFHDLKSPDSLFNEVTDVSRGEKYRLEDFFDAKENERYLVMLINRCLQELLKTKGFSWMREDHLFLATPPENLHERSSIDVKWKDGKLSTRNIFKVRTKLDDGRLVCRHFAFSASPVFFENDWFLSVRPTWIETMDGQNKAFYSDKSVSSLKRLERNSAVRNHVRYIFSILKSDNQKMFFAEEYQFLKFAELLSLTIKKGMNEKEWLESDSNMPPEIIAEDVNHGNTFF